MAGGAGAGATVAGAAVAGASPAVFVYGTLLDDDVVNAVLHRVPRFASATLYGYQRHSIKGRVYPAIVPAVEKKVDGRVFLDLTVNEIQVLDEFEDSEYTRSLVNVLVLDNESKDNILEAFAYVWHDTNDTNLYGEWSFEEWKATHKEEFVKMCNHFISDCQESKGTRRVDVYEELFDK